MVNADRTSRSGVPEGGDESGHARSARFSYFFRK